MPQLKSHNGPHAYTELPAHSFPDFSLSLGFSTAQSAAAMEVPTGENEVLSYLWSNVFLRGYGDKTLFSKEDGGTKFLAKK